MSEIIRDRVMNSIGKVAKIFLYNGFRYEGKITNADNEFIELLDFRTNAYKIINLKDIKDMEVKE